MKIGDVIEVYVIAESLETIQKLQAEVVAVWGSGVLVLKGKRNHTYYMDTLKPTAFHTFEDAKRALIRGLEQSVAFHEGRLKRAKGKLEDALLISEILEN